MENLSNPLMPQIIHSNALASINRKDKTIAQGSKTTRLILGHDPRFYVAVKVIDQHSSELERLSTYLGKLAGRYVEIKQGNTSLFINVNSVASRLLLKKNDVLQAAKRQDTFLSLLTKQAENANLIISKYGKIKDQFLKEHPTLSGHWTKTLLKVIKVTVHTEISYYAPLSIEGHTYHIGFDLKNQRVVLTTIGQTLGQGSFGKIINLTTSGIAEAEVIKQALAEQGKKAEEDVRNEHNQLKEIHKNGNVWGIQASPRTLIQIKEKVKNQGVKLLGYIGVKYERDYYDEVVSKLSLPFSSRVAEFQQLLFGLKELTVRNIVHGDLKPENILVRQDPKDGTQLVHISDLGGSVFAKSSIPLEQLAGFSRSYTPLYTPLQDFEKAQKLVEKGNYAALLELEKKRDVFAMGTILYFALTGNAPFNSLESGFPNLESAPRKILRTDVPQEIKDLIFSMLTPSDTQRPTAEEVFQKYEAFLQSNYPSVHQQIQAKIQQDYTGSTFVA